MELEYKHLRVSKRRLYCMALSFALVTIINTLRVEARDFEGMTVSGVELRYEGNLILNARGEEELRSRISTKVGSKFRNSVLQHDTDSIYRSGSFVGVAMYGEQAGGKVCLVVQVRIRPEILGGVEFVGNEVFADKKLAEKSGLMEGGFPSIEQISNAMGSITANYLLRGYPDVSVGYSIKDNPDNESSSLVFVIDEGSKMEFRDIRFEGVTAIPEADLHEIMTTKKKDPFSLVSSTGYIFPKELEADLEVILDYYRSHGYLRASSPGIRRELVEDGRVDLIIQIEEGEKYTVGGVGFGKMTVFPPEDLYPLLTLNGNDAYSSKKMRADITTIRSFYGSRGYADALVTPDIRDAGPNKVNITYRITEGRKFRVGRVNISGNTKTKDIVIRREILLKPGDHFNSVELESTKSRLENLRYFSAVHVTGSPSGEGYRDLNVLVEEKVTGGINVGVNASTVVGITGFFQIHNTNLDLITGGDRMGGGVRGRIVTDFSQEGITAELQMNILAIGDRPVGLPSDWCPPEEDLLKRQAKGSLAKDPP